MTLYTVHRRAGEAPDRAVLVRDGFCWGAFVFGFLWALWHRMWLVAAGLLLIDGLIAAAASWFGFAPAIPALANLVVALIFAFEARDLQRWSLDATGQREVALSAGGNLAEAELRYFSRCIPEVAPAGPWRAMPPTAAHDTLGLFGRA